MEFNAEADEASKAKRKRELTAAEKAERRRRRAESMIVFVNGKQKRVKRPVLIEGLDPDEYYRRNAGPIAIPFNEDVSPSLR